MNWIITQIETTIGKAIPWWVKLLAAMILIAILWFAGWMIYRNVNAYMAEHDNAIAEAADYKAKLASAQHQLSLQRACQQVTDQAQTVSDNVTKQALPVLQANTEKHQRVRDAIEQSPPSDDAPMAPVLRDTFERLYAPPEAASGPASGGAGDGSPH